MLKLTKKREQELLDRVWEDYEFGQRARNLKENDWKNARMQYASEWTELQQVESDEDLTDWFYVPKTWMIINRIVATLLQHFFPRGRRKLGIVLPPTELGDLPVAAKMADQVLHAKLDLEAWPREPCRDAFESSLVEGTGWVKGGWVREVRQDSRGQPMLINRPSFTYVPNEHIVCDPYALTDSDIKWVAHTVWLTEDELWARQRQGIYQNVGDLPKADETREDIWRQFRPSTSGRQRGMYRVIEFWGLQQVETEQEVENQLLRGRFGGLLPLVVTTYKNEVLLRADLNPYAVLRDRPEPFDQLPYFKCTPLPKRGDVWAESLVTRIRPIQREMNTMRNQRRIAVGMEGNPKVLYDQTRLTDVERLVAARYGGVVPTNGPPGDVVHILHIPTSTGNAVQEELMLDADLREGTGVTHYHEGSVVPGMQETATGVSIVAAEGNVKLDTLVENVGQSLILPMVRFALECCIEWVEPEEIQEVIHSIMTPPRLRDILTRDYHVELEAGKTATSREADIRRQEFALQALSVAENAAPGTMRGAMLALAASMLKDLNVPEASMAIGAALEAQAGPPRQQTPTMQNPGYRESLDQQGRVRTLQEMPR